MRTIWYMGAKTRLTAEILRAVEDADPRAERVLDLMSGTAVVSRALAPRYAVTANDAQRYAAAIARAYLQPELRRAQRARLLKLDPVRDLEVAYRENLDRLLPHFEPAIALEDAYLRAFGLTPESPDASAGEVLPFPEVGEVALKGDDPARAYRRFALDQTPLPGRGRPGGPFHAARGLFARKALEARRLDPGVVPYCLAATYYANVYLGVRQAVAVDSLRHAIDRLPRRTSLQRAKRDLYLGALLHACSVTTSATSHFCQPRGLVRDAEVKAVLLRRAQSIASRMAAALAAIAGDGSALGEGHQVLCGGWRQAYAAWDQVDAQVVYADPPYTADHYSRFYHALEVLTDYDYPALQVQGGRVTKGRYPVRERRFRSGFCGRGQVEGELRALIGSTAERGAALVLSYGAENGLLLRQYRDRGASPAAALRQFEALAGERYAEVELRRKTLLHSGQGDSNHAVTELLLIARRPRGQRGAACA